MKQRIFNILALFFFSSVVLAQAESLPLQLSHDVIIFKDFHGKTYAQVGSLRVAEMLKLKVGDYLQEEGMKDYEIIQKAIDSLPGGGLILIKRGMYDLGKKGITIPYCSHFIIEGEGFDPYAEALQEIYKDNWSYGGSCLVYKGEGKAVTFKGVEKKKMNFAIFELKNIAIRLKEKCEGGIYLPCMNYVIFENVGIATDKEAEYGICLDGEGGATKHLKTIYIKGPFQTGMDIKTDHTLVMKTQIEDYRGYGIMLGKDTKILAGILKTDKKEAIAGISTYQICCPKECKEEEPPVNTDEHWRASYPCSVINTFDESIQVSAKYIPFLADACNLVLVGCGKNPALKTDYFYHTINGGKIFDEGQALKEARK